MNPQQLFFNGIDLETGGYACPPIPIDHALGARVRPYKQSGNKNLPTYLSPQNLVETRWGVIVHEKDGEAVLKHLAPLLDLRGKAMGTAPPVFTFKAEDHKPDNPNFEPGMTTLNTFLTRHNVGLTGTIQPAEIPYYLLIAASPEDISFDFQMALSASYAVGRLHFDHLDDYRAYAENQVAVETARRCLPRTATFLGPVHDPLTEVTCRDMIEPLHRSLSRIQTDRQFRVFAGDSAVKTAFTDALAGSDLVVSAGHGLAMPSEEMALAYQGAPLFHDWVLNSRPSLVRHVFSHRDVTGDYRGLVLWLTACFSAGTPTTNVFHALGFGTQEHFSKPFVAATAKALLKHPKGPAALIGHVDQAWTDSFKYHKSILTIEPFTEVFHQVMEGQPVGHALRPIRNHYQVLRGAEGKARSDLPHAAFCQWLASRDARGYVLLGDPAVRAGRMS